MLGREVSNPFCTRFFQPGAVPFFFEDGASLVQLVERWLQSGARRVSIVGPHGTGKSTLVTHLLQFLQGGGPFATIVPLQFRTQDTIYEHGRELIHARRSLKNGAPSLLVIDGYEQLRGPLRWVARRLGGGGQRWILITSHGKEPHFEVLWETRMNPGTEAHVLQHLLRTQSDLLPESVMQTQEWNRSRAIHGDNLRESLFDMYDWYRDRVDAPKQGR